MVVKTKHLQTKGPIPEANPTESERRILPDLVGFRIRSDSVGFGRICSDLVGFGQILISGKFGRNRSELVGVGIGRIWLDLVGICRICSDSVRFGRNGQIWSDSVGFGRIWLDSVGVASGRGPKLSYLRKQMAMAIPPCVHSLYVGPSYRVIEILAG